MSVSFITILLALLFSAIGLISLLVFAFIAFMFIRVLVQRINNEEDNYYEKNVKD